MSKDFLTITVSCKCGGAKLSGNMMPTSLEEINSLLELCRAVLPCEWSGVKFMEDLGGPRPVLNFQRECRRQHSSQLARGYQGN